MFVHGRKFGDILSVCSIPRVFSRGENEFRRAAGLYESSRAVTQVDGLPPASSLRFVSIMKLYRAHLFEYTVIANDAFRNEIGMEYAQCNSQIRCLMSLGYDYAFAMVALRNHALIIFLVVNFRSHHAIRSIVFCYIVLQYIFNLRFGAVAPIICDHGFAARF